jgi:hypothetical protein
VSDNSSGTGGICGKARGEIKERNRTVDFTGFDQDDVVAICVVLNVIDGDENIGSI